MTEYELEQSVNRLYQLKQHREREHQRPPTRPMSSMEIEAMVGCGEGIPKVYSAIDSQPFLSVIIMMLLNGKVSLGVEGTVSA